MYYLFYHVSAFFYTQMWHTRQYYYFGSKRLMEVNFRFNIISTRNEFLTTIKVYTVILARIWQWKKIITIGYTKLSMALIVKGVHARAENVKWEGRIQRPLRKTQKEVWK